MTLDSENRAVARQYLLGQLAAEDLDEVERRFLEDPDFEDIVLEMEYDLLDAASAGELSPAEAHAVRSWNESRPTHRLRLDMAETFGRLSATPDAAPRRLQPMRDRSAGSRFPAQAYSLAALAAICLLLAGITLRLLVNNRNLQSQLKAQTAISRPPSSAIASPANSPAAAVTPQQAETPAASPPAPTIPVILLMAQENRGSADIATLRRSKITPRDEVEFQLSSESGLPQGRCTATVTASNGKIVFRSADLAPLHEHGERYFSFRIAAELLQLGLYHVELTAKNSTREPSTTYLFRVAD